MAVVGVSFIHYRSVLPRCGEMMLGGGFQLPYSTISRAARERGSESVIEGLQPNASLCVCVCSCADDVALITKESKRRWWNEAGEWIKNLGDTREKKGVLKRECSIAKWVR